MSWQVQTVTVLPTKVGSQPLRQSFHWEWWERYWNCLCMEKLYISTGLRMQVRSTLWEDSHPCPQPSVLMDAGCLPQSIPARFQIAGTQQLPVGLSSDWEAKRANMPCIHCSPTSQAEWCSGKGYFIRERAGWRPGGRSPAPTSDLMRCQQWCCTASKQGPILNSHWICAFYQCNTPHKTFIWIGFLPGLQCFEIQGAGLAQQSWCKALHAWGLVRILQAWLILLLFLMFCHLYRVLVIFKKAVTDTTWARLPQTIMDKALNGNGRAGED